MTRGHYGAPTTEQLRGTNARSLFSFFWPWCIKFTGFFFFFPKKRRGVGIELDHGFDGFAIGGG
jgi:hypothetical protein